MLFFFSLISKKKSSYISVDLYLIKFVDDAALVLGLTLTCMVSNSSYSSVGLMLTWSMGRKLALHITFYHKVHVVMGLLDFGSLMH